MGERPRCMLCSEAKPARDDRDIYCLDCREKVDRLQAEADGILVGLAKAWGFQTGDSPPPHAEMHRPVPLPPPTLPMRRRHHG